MIRRLLFINWNTWHQLKSRWHLFLNERKSYPFLLGYIVSRISSRDKVTNQFSAYLWFLEECREFTSSHSYEEAVDVLTSYRLLIVHSPNSIVGPDLSACLMSCISLLSVDKIRLDHFCRWRITQVRRCRRVPSVKELNQFYLSISNIVIK